MKRNGSVKKVTVTFFAALFLAACMVTVTCETEVTHKHTYEWVDTGNVKDVIDKEATIAAAGKKHQEKEQRETCVEDGTTKGTRWVIIPDTEQSIPKLHEHTYVWQDTGATKWVTSKQPTTTATGLEHKEKEQKEICLEDDTIRKTQWITIPDTEREIPKLVEQISLSNKTPGVASIDMIDTISDFNRGVRGVANGVLSNVNTMDVVEGILPKLSGQAAQLQGFLQDCKGDALFTDLAAIENTIRIKVQSTTPQQFVATVDSSRAAMVLLLTQGMSSTDKEKFEKMLTGYQAGHYLITRDWRTAGGLTETNRITNFLDAGVAASAQSPVGGTYNNGRGTIIPQIGTNVPGQLLDIETALVNMGVAELSKRGITGDQATAMVKALIIQLGQDTVEFEAFVDDIVAEPTITTADTMTYTMTPAG